MKTFDMVFESMNLNFHEKLDHSMRNFITDKVFSDNIIKDILGFDESGKNRYKTIVRQRL